MKNRQRKLDPAFIYNQLLISEYIVMLTPIVVFSVFTISVLHPLIFLTYKPHVTTPTEIYTLKFANLAIP